MMTDTIYVAKKTIQDFQTLSNAPSSKDWYSLIALFLSALVAVLVGQWLQNRKSKSDRIYNNKFYVFATILGYRHALGWDESFVVAINQVPIVFNKNKIILTKLDKFIQKHRAEKQLSKDLIACLNDLILEIAKDLNYHDIDNSTISTDFFRPDASFFRYKSEEIRNYEFVQERQPKAENTIGEEHD